MASDSERNGCRWPGCEARQRDLERERDEARAALANCTTACKRLLADAERAEQDAARLADALAEEHDDGDDNVWGRHGCSACAALDAHRERVRGGGAS